MIPERIYLVGFLCYREPQEARFDECPVWMIAGENGSGKSALFDAVTYALYGIHRGGRQNARGLINQASERLVVEFDFRIETEVYRARRTFARTGRGTRQLLVREPPGDGDAASCWQEIPATSDEQGFSRWIQDNVGLTYETFTSSVLLLQGKADSLLSLAPARRRELLAQLVGLERFQQLQEKAREHVAQSQAVLGRLRQQLRLLPAVTNQRLQKAERQVQVALASHREAAARAEHFRKIRQQAGRWDGLQARLVDVQHRLQTSRKLLEQGEAIEAAHQRWKQLEAHLEKLPIWEQHSRGLHECRKAGDRLSQQQLQLREKLLELDRRSRRTLRDLEAAERELEQATGDSRLLTERSAALAVSVAELQRLRSARDEQHHAAEAGRAAGKRLEQAEVARRRVLANRPAGAECDEAHAQVRQAAERVARTETVLQDVREQHDRFQQVRAVHTCPYCRQPLGKDHLHRERVRVQELHITARAQYDQARDELREAQRKADSLDKSWRSAQHELEQLEPSITDFQACRRSARDLEAQSRRMAQQALREVPVELLTELGVDRQDWVESDGPTTKQLASLEQRREQMAAELEKLNRESYRLGQCIENLRAGRLEWERQRRRVQAEAEAVSQQAALRLGRATHHQEALESMKAALPIAWQSWSGDEVANHAKQLKLECESLRRSDIGGRFDELQDASDTVERLSCELRLLKEQAAECVPELHETPESVEVQLQQAVRDCDRCQSGLQEAARDEARLRQDSERRLKLSGEIKQAERQNHLWNRLALLIGPDFLQRHVLSNAERAIVQYADAILDRLGGGQLYLQLRQEPASSPRPLDLVARTVTCGNQLQDVAFLSGSQRFRVAVALSLAIGQYASRQRRPVQAVIIDEGFGCLDALNRQVMVQELQNLRNHLQRILLVSHQEEFAGAFADGYCCELVEGSTRLAPFHR